MNKEELQELAMAVAQQDIGPFDDPLIYLEKMSFFVLSFALMYGLYTVAARTGHKAISRNLDEAEHIIEAAKNDDDPAHAAFRYALAGKILLAHTLRLSVMSVMSGLLAMGL